MLDKPVASHFIRTIIETDLAAQKYRRLITRFPPEPNGYLHVGHAKSICLNFGLADDYGGDCHLRLDDTNPEKESEEYARSIQEDVRWLGFKWAGEVRWASDYFEHLYEYALHFIDLGLAYVCELDADTLRLYRGTLTEPGRDSPFRGRPVSQNRRLFEQMRAGALADGSHTLRLKIDMAAPNINLRDPVIYRIRRMHHIRTGDDWCIYPMYDYAHCISDALEGITHSLCTLEFEDHRPLYDWILDRLTLPNRPSWQHRPYQYEFSRLELQYTVTSKRKLTQLVTENLVEGWDDPRMPTIAGMRRRGYTPAGLHLFAERIGVSKSDNIVDLHVLESSIRDDLESAAPRVMAIIAPLKVTIINADEVGWTSREAAYHPSRSEFGSRKVNFSDTLWIERDDFAEEPPTGWQRLAPGREIRLRYSYVIRCEAVVRGATGEITELRCSIDPDTLGKNPAGRSVKGVIHWLSAAHAMPAEIRLYDRLFTVSRPDAMLDEQGVSVDFRSFINADSIQTVHGWVEATAAQAAPETRYQFERIGYFCADRWEHRPGTRAVFNRTVALKDRWTPKAKDS